MAKQINLTSGSILAGNPITFKVKPETLSKKPSFHRVIVEVACGLEGGDYQTVKLTVPVSVEGNDVEFDISSALRVPLDSFEYNADTTEFPWVQWQVLCYDEYMDSNGDVHTEQGKVYFPSKDSYYRAIAGAFTDMERIISTDGTKAVKELTRKPTSMPHLTAVGEQFTYAQPYSEEQKIEASATLAHPTSATKTIEKEGSQQLGYQQIYALPASEATKRCEFRFINSFGVMESISVPRAYQKTFSMSSTAYAKAVQETFGKFSRSAIRKVNNKEAWVFTTDPLNEDWLHWYLHEFLMSEHVWIKINGNWIFCTVTIDDELTFYDTTQGQMFYLGFTATLDINGSPF